MVGRLNKIVFTTTTLLVALASIDASFVVQHQVDTTTPPCTTLLTCIKQKQQAKRNGNGPLVSSSSLSTTPAASHVLKMSSDDDDGWTPSKSAMIGGAGVNNAGEPPFEIRGFSLGNLIVTLGVVITVASFADYLGSEDSLSVSGLGFVYGIPVFLAGAALKYAEIDPVPVRTSEQAETLFEAKATETIQKIKQDVTRHRYGDEAHLDTTVKKLGLVVPGKAYPQLMELRQGVSETGELEFMMVWQSLDTPYKMWADERRVKKYETFFGPKVKADVVKVDAEQRMVGIRLTTTTAETSSTTAASTTAGSSTTATL